MDRRRFLSEISRFALVCAGTPNVWRVTRRPQLASNPFTLGVASGDPTPTGAVIWTRLAPRPLEPEGGMAGQRTLLDWQVAEDEGFARVVQRGRVTAAPELGYSAHVDVAGLAPDRWYFYRFTMPAGPSPAGRLRTAPPPGGETPLRFGFASCQHYEEGYFTAYAHLAREEIDLVTHLGDYIYEYGGREGRVRRYPTTEIQTLEHYRIRYGATKSDPDLMAAHARAPWVVTWDDHEVDNNYAGRVGENGMESEEQVLQRRAMGYQAWWENQPVRVPRARSWAELSITRTIDWGALARFWVLDGRQFRSDQACGDGIRVVPCGDWNDPARSMLGAAQERWLTSGLAASRAGWQVLANQTALGAQIDSLPGEGRMYSMDSWSGYPAARDRLIAAIDRHARHRTVVITGDIHSSWVNEVRGRPDASGPPVATEFIGTSISSGGDGSDLSTFWIDPIQAENPQVKWQNGRRGYVVCEVSQAEWRARYRTLPYVSRPGAPVATASTWVVERGVPGVRPA